MAKSLEQILGHEPLTESLRIRASGIPNPFPEPLFSVKSSNRVLGDRAKYIRITGERRTAKTAEYGSPAKRRKLLDIGDASVRMLHTYENFTIGADILNKLRSMEQYTQDEGMDWLAYQIEEAGRRAMNTRIMATASVLRHGAIYVDSTGDLLPTSSGADETYSYNIPSTHQTQINGIITASWANPNTDIPSHIRNLKQYSRQETGMELTTCLYGIEIPSYMANNNFVQAYLARNSQSNSQFLSSNEIPDGLFGINWVPVYNAFVEDDDGTLSELWADDICTFMPDISQPDKMNWWGMFEGSYMVPRSLNIAKNPTAALANMENVYGMGSYFVAKHDPTSFDVYYFDTFLPGLKNEKALFQADVVF